MKKEEEIADQKIKTFHEWLKILNPRYVNEDLYQNHQLPYDGYGVVEHYLDARTRYIKAGHTFNDAAYHAINEVWKYYKPHFIKLMQEVQK